MMSDVGACADLLQNVSDFAFDPLRTLSRLKTKARRGPIRRRGLAVAGECRLIELFGSADMRIPRLKGQGYVVLPLESGLSSGSPVR
jgi:hypothetical protein